MLARTGRGKQPGEVVPAANSVAARTARTARAIAAIAATAGRLPEHVVDRLELADVLGRAGLGLIQLLVGIAELGHRHGGTCGPVVAAAAASPFPAILAARATTAVTVTTLT